MPETYFECAERYEGVGGLEDIKRKKKLRCEFCSKSDGYPLQCSHPGCKRSFHPICALYSGRSHMQIIDESDPEYAKLSRRGDAGGHIKVAYCSEHTDVHDPARNAKCMKCGRFDGATTMVLCSECDRGWHIRCMDPPRKTVPSGDWFCKDCVRRRLSLGTIIEKPTRGKKRKRKSKKRESGGNENRDSANADEDQNVEYVALTDAYVAAMPAPPALLSSDDDDDEAIYSADEESSGDEKAAATKRRARVADMGGADEYFTNRHSAQCGLRPVPAAGKKRRRGRRGAKSAARNAAGTSKSTTTTGAPLKLKSLVDMRPPTDEDARAMVSKLPLKHAAETAKLWHHYVKQFPFGDGSL